MFRVSKTGLWNGFRKLVDLFIIICFEVLFDITHAPKWARKKWYMACHAHAWEWVKIMLQTWIRMSEKKKNIVCGQEFTERAVHSWFYVVFNHKQCLFWPKKIVVCWRKYTEPSVCFWSFIFSTTNSFLFGTTGHVLDRIMVHICMRHVNITHMHYSRWKAHGYETTLSLLELDNRSLLCGNRSLLCSNTSIITHALFALESTWLWNNSLSIGIG